MRIRTICFSCLLAFALIKGASAQQPAQPQDTNKDKKTAGPAGDLSLAPSKENWTTLNDLKTGLHPTTADDLARVEQPEFVRELVRVEWRPGDPLELWISRPKTTAQKVPVVLYLYNYTDTGDRFSDNAWCKRATADGFAAVGFVSAFADYRFRMRPMKQWFISELPEALGSTVHDVQLILDYLAARGDMDMDRVGMFGMDSGGAIAILAAQADSRIKTLDVLNPWGDWPDWLQQSPAVPEAERAKYTTPQFLKSVEALDPLAYLPKLKTPNFRFQQILNDTATPKAAKDRLAAAVPNQNALVKYPSGEELLKAWQTSGLAGWIKQHMQSRPPQKAIAAKAGSF